MEFVLGVIFWWIHVAMLLFHSHFRICTPCFWQNVSLIAALFLCALSLSHVAPSLRRLLYLPMKGLVLSSLLTPHLLNCLTHNLWLTLKIRLCNSPSLLEPFQDLVDTCIYIYIYIYISNPSLKRASRILYISGRMSLLAIGFYMQEPFSHRSIEY